MSRHDKRPDTHEPDHDLQEWHTEVARLNKIIRVLMDRAERSATVQGSDFNIFQATILLEEQVRKRTAELEAALKQNEIVTAALRSSEARFRGVVSQSLVGITIFDTGVLTYANEMFAKIFGRSVDEMIGRDPIWLFHPDDQAIVSENIRRRETGEVASVEYTVRGVKPGGELVYVEIHGNAMDLNGNRVLISTFLDVTDRVMAENKVRALQEHLRELTVRDPLTGAFNRRHLEHRLQDKLHELVEKARTFALVVVDVDHFKSINDNLGHLAGDGVLREVAARLSAAKDGGEVFRFGGEEFVMLLPDVDLAQASQLANANLLAISGTPFAVGEKAIRVTASFGVALATLPCPSADQLIAKADKAMYRAKSAGRNRVEVADDDGSLDEALR